MAVCNFFYCAKMKQTSRFHAPALGIDPILRPGEPCRRRASLTSRPPYLPFQRWYVCSLDESLFEVPPAAMGGKRIRYW